MKKIVLLILGTYTLLLSSCFYTIHGVTNNPIGKKSGTVIVGLFQPDQDFSYNAAAKRGNINKIGAWEIKVGFAKISTTVTGEAIEKPKKNK